jgi:hypothetical protein
VAERILSVQEAYELSKQGNREAFCLLSEYANGGDSNAQGFVRQIDETKISFKAPETSKPRQNSNLIEILVHPMRAIRTKMRQLEVGCDMAAAPIGSNQEDFPELSLQKAAQLMEQKGGGVQLEDWSKRDQEKLKRGERPRGVPTHLDI